MAEDEFEAVEARVLCELDMSETDLIVWRLGVEASMGDEALLN